MTQPMHSGSDQRTSSPSHERDEADHDEAYTWSRPPSTYLAPREVVRLMILRSRLEERHTLRHRAHGPASRRATTVRATAKH